MSSAHRYTDFELRAMMQDVESDLVKRKESLRGDAPTSIREAVCAFANDLPDHRRPGVVFVGADNAGRPTGLPITDALLRQPGFVAYRNPLLAEAMRVLELVQRWGSGLPIARRELRANRQPPPAFTVTPQRLFCTVQARSIIDSPMLR